MAKDTPEGLILEALGRAVASPQPLPMHGTKAKPGIFLKNTPPARSAAQLALDRKWLRPTGQVQGKGKSARPLYCITAPGVQHALAHGEVVQLLNQLRAAADAQRATLDGMRVNMQALGQALQSQVDALQGVERRVQPPDIAAAVKQLAQIEAGRDPVATSQPDNVRLPNEQRGSRGPGDWVDSIVAFVRSYASGMCPLPELYRRVAEPRRVSVGQFHDGLRELVAARRLRLHPWTGPMYQLKDEQFALLLGQEIKYYADVE